MPRRGSTGIGHTQEHDWNQQALADRPSAPTWRFWRYPQAAVVLGRAQARFLPSVQTVPMLVRSSGGGAVLVGPWMLGLSVVLPCDHPWALGAITQSYLRMGNCLAQALNRLGIETRVAHAQLGFDPVHCDLSWACFGGLSFGELTVQGRKVVGIAQQRRRHAALLAAGILCEPPPWSVLCAALSRPPQDAQGLQQCTIALADLGTRACNASWVDCAEHAINVALQQALD